LKRLVIILFALPVILVLVLVFGRMRWKFSQPPPKIPTRVEVVASNVVATMVSAPAVVPAGQDSVSLGETILRDYASASQPPEHDLTLMSHLMENSVLLLKSAANRPLSANEDWADLFLGKNSAQEAFLPPSHVALNAHGQLVDRWQTPLFFHALGGGRYEIRSAGPDKKMWSADDIQRNANGTFLRVTN